MLSSDSNTKTAPGRKFEEVTNDGVLLGFVDDNFNYRVVNLDTNKILISHNVSFQETIFPFQRLIPKPVDLQEDPLEPPSRQPIPNPPTPSTQSDDDETFPVPADTDRIPTDTEDPDLISPATPPPTPSPAIPPPIAARRSSRIRNQPECYTPGANSVILSPRQTASLAQAQTLHHTFWHNPDSFVETPDKPDAYAFSTAPTVRLLDEPKTFAQAMTSPNAACWKAACGKELEAFRQKGVWNLVSRPNNKNVIKGCWVFKIKLKEDSEISNSKASYVAKGYSQVEGVDLFETFSPTGKPASFRTFIATAAANGWEI